MRNNRKKKKIKKMYLKNKSSQNQKVQMLIALFLKISSI